MGIVKDILKKRTENRARLEKEAPNLYNGFNELMKHYYKHDVLDFLDEIEASRASERKS